jgi:cation-transporting P-type ATPase I
MECRSAERAGLASVHLVVEAVSVARRVSSRSATLALAGTGVGGLWSILGPSGSAGRRAALPMNAAALAAQAQGVASAVALGRRPGAVRRSQTPWHTMEGPAVLKALGTTSAGLTTAEALRRRVDRHREPPGIMKLTEAIGAEFMNPLTPVLAVGAGLAAAVGSVADAGLVAGVTAANAVIGGIQKFRADVSIERLLQVSGTVVDVRRSGKTVPVDRDALVRGDVLELSAGDVVPADCRILETDSCDVDESVLTGESLPVAKHAGVVHGTAPADLACMLYEGTTVSSGTALAVVVAVGIETEVGRSLADAPEPPASGVEARLGALMRVTLPATLASGAAVTGMSLLRGRSMRRAVSSGVSLMVAAVPEGLPLLATAAQLAAARRLSERGALVRNPRTIEALGRVDLLCFDKTGTLTLGEIALQRVSDGHTDGSLGTLENRSRAVLAAALRASPETSGSDVVLLPHATDRAVIAGALRAQVSASDELGGWSLIDDLPFDPVRGFHAVIGDSPQGPRVSVKGAPEVIHPRCASWLSPEGPVPIDRRVQRKLDAEVERLARRGLRVLAVAERAASSRTEVAAERVAGVELLGYLGLADSVRPTAAAAVSALRAAGSTPREHLAGSGDRPGRQPRRPPQ